MSINSHPKVVIAPRKRCKGAADAARPTGERRAPASRTKQCGPEVGSSEIRQASGGGGGGLLLALGDVSNDKIRVIPHGMLCVPFPVPPRAAGIGPYSQRPHREEEKKARKGPLHWGLHCTNFSGLQLFSSVKWGFVNKYLFQELRGFKS